MKGLDSASARLFSGIWNRFHKVPIRLLPEDLPHARLSFSQHGEDLLVVENLQFRAPGERGIYIDAGCFDPFRYSNTRLLNLLGWRGINIDAGADVIEEFDRHRPGDCNVCAALSNKAGEMVLAGRTGSPSRRLVARSETADKGTPVATTTLREVLGSSPFANSPVDLLDIDCECHDREVLEGFPFECLSPALICIEAHTPEEARDLDSFLVARDYIRVGTRGPSRIYRNKPTIPKNIPYFTRISEL